MKLECKTCGSTNIRRDAWAEWDQELQQWLLGDLYDKEVWCSGCDTEGWDNIKEEEEEDEDEDEDEEDDIN